MNSLLFRIFFTTVVSMLTDCVFASTNLHDFINAIKSPKTDQIEEDKDSKEFINSSLVLVVHHQTPGEEFSMYDEDKKLLLNHPNLSDKILQRHVDTNHDSDKGRLRMGAIPIIKRTVGRIRRNTTTVRARNTTVKKAIAARERDHQRRVKEIIDHMTKYFTSALYLYNETRRIEKTHVVMDELRVMAMDAEQPKYLAMKKNIIKCAYVPPKAPPKQIWVKTNNNVINIAKDSINDGVPI